MKQERERVSSAGSDSTASLDFEEFRLSFDLPDVVAVYSRYKDLALVVVHKDATDHLWNASRLLLNKRVLIERKITESKEEKSIRQNETN